MHRSTHLTGVEFSHLLKYWSHTAVPWPGVGKPIPEALVTAQPTANQLKTATFHGGHTPCLDGVVRDLPQYSHSPNTPWPCQPRAVTGRGMCTRSNSPSHPGSVYLPLPRQREARDIGCHGDGGWEGSLGKQGPEPISQVGGKGAHAKPGTC